MNVSFQYKLLEKEKRQMETKMDKLDKLSRALQQERSDLQATIKNLSKSSAGTTPAAAAPPPPPAATAAAPVHPPENENETHPSDATPDESANLYGSFLDDTMI